VAGKDFVAGVAQHFPGTFVGFDVGSGGGVDHQHPIADAVEQATENHVPVKRYKVCQCGPGMRLHPVGKGKNLHQDSSNGQTFAGLELPRPSESARYGLPLRPVCRIFAA
jgi:hypothetical protein